MLKRTLGTAVLSFGLVCGSAFIVSAHPAAQDKMQDKKNDKMSHDDKMAHGDKMSSDDNMSHQKKHKKSKSDDKMSQDKMSDSKPQ
ncbi:MAG TPA: hypothetical protein VFB14_02915 [Bryobacteraceae bacterium]|jgi:pentapeptide MXKDX repeat protein|nr:hypothetical protein [Bryobacteraceae bacterium]